MFTIQEEFLYDLIYAHYIELLTPPATLKHIAYLPYEYMAQEARPTSVVSHAVVSHIIPAFSVL